MIGNRRGYMSLKYIPMNMYTVLSSVSKSCLPQPHSCILCYDSGLWTDAPREFLRLRDLLVAGKPREADSNGAFTVLSGSLEL